MKKFIRITSLVLVMALCITFLTGCSKCTQKYADKINKRANEDKFLTYEQVMRALGDEAVDATVELGGYRTGLVTLTEEKGNLKKVIVVTIADGKAKSALYSEEEIKK